MVEIFGNVCMLALILGVLFLTLLGTLQGFRILMKVWKGVPLAKPQKKVDETDSLRSALVTMVREKDATISKLANKLKEMAHRYEEELKGFVPAPSEGQYCACIVEDNHNPVLISECDYHATQHAKLDMATDALLEIINPESCPDETVRARAEKALEYMKQLD